MLNPFLSIIIPAHNEESRLQRTLQQVGEFVQSQTYSVEVLVVENGSQDRTLEIARTFAIERPQFHVFHIDERGKGLAVKRGMLEARGEYRFMCDADLSMPVTEIKRFIPPALTEFEVAIASREAQGAVRYNEPFYRHIGGRGINAMIRLLALPGLHDTQCGFKCFRADVVDDLFGHQTMVGWSFDVELLYIARMRGYRIIEIPIPWYFNPETKLNAIQDAVIIGRDVLTIRRSAANGIYDRSLPEDRDS